MGEAVSIARDVGRLMWCCDSREMAHSRAEGEVGSTDLVGACNDLGECAVSLILPFDECLEDGRVVGPQVGKYVADAGLISQRSVLFILFNP